METDKKPEPRQLKIESGKPALEKGKSRGKREESTEVGGHKLWVLAIMVVTIILGLIFSLKAGLPQFSLGGGSNSSSPKPVLNLDLFGSKVYEFSR